MSTNFKRRVVAKTAAYTVSLLRDIAATVFTNRGAVGAVTFTLPTPGAQYLGVPYSFRCVVDQNLTVAGTTNGDLVSKNDQTLASIALSTAGELIGGTIEAECIETAAGTYKWLVWGSAVGHTYTLA